MNNEENATEVDVQVASLDKQQENDTTVGAIFKDSAAPHDDIDFQISIEQAEENGSLSRDDAQLIKYALGWEEWPDPLPLISKTTSSQFPIDALPESIRLVVQEVTEFVQCPPALAYNSAMATISLAAQGLANIRRSEGLCGPTSIYSLVIAESGERKTTCDNYFTQSIRKWESDQLENMQFELNKYTAELIVYNAKIAGIEAEIKQRAKSGKDTIELESDLESIIACKPIAPRIPRLSHGDATPEALAWSFHNGWHSGGILTSEAGSLFGSHGMSKESAMRNLALLNILWEDGELPIERRSSECFTVRGVRLTMGLAVQLETLRSFLNSSDGLVRGIGFASRLLISWPASTQGSRMFKDQSMDSLYLKSFHSRIEKLLNIPLNLNELGEINPTMLDLSPEAKKEWIRFHNDVELQLNDDGELTEIRDVASKAADNATRLAANFHLYEYGLTGNVSYDLMHRACLIMDWHLSEAKRFFREIALPINILNASKLDAWIVARCLKNSTNFVSRRDVQKLGPYSLRVKESLNIAIEILEDLDRIKVVDDGRKKHIYINSKLLKI